MGALGRLQELSKLPAKSAIPLLTEVIEIGEKTNRNPFRKMIGTKSNLRFDVLEQLCSMAGVDFGPFCDDEAFINNDLCNSRNEIAHGSPTDPSVETFIKRRDRTFDIMTKLQTILINAAVNESFKA